MRMLSSAFAAAALLAACVTAVAQSGAHWDKTYPLNGRPHLQVEVGDAAVQISGCGSCSGIHIHVDGRGEDLSGYTIREMQGGNTVHFNLNQKPGGSWFRWGMHSGPVVTVELPTAADVTARSGDGSVALRDLAGTVDVHTSDGSVSASHLSGTLRLDTSDGSLSIQDAEGTLDAHTSDGSMSIRGRFTAINAHTSDGSGSVTLEQGTHLNTASSIVSQDGSLSVRMPRDLAADLDLSSGDGHVSCSLPMQTDTSGSGEHQHMHGRLNGGGPLLTVRTADGSISVAGL